nr:DUF2691 family protein [Clostridium sp.]
YTYLKEIFEAINNKQLNYNWLLTEVECYPADEDLDEYFFYGNYFFMTGEELTKMIEEDDFQWIWGIFSGFKKDKSLDEILKYELPNFEDTGCFHNPVTIQHPLADIEISVWDSSYTVIVSKDEKVLKDYKSYFKDSMDLEEYNNNRKRT